MTSPPAGTYVLCAKVSDSGGQTALANYSWEIAALLQIPFSTLGPINVGVSSQLFLNENGGNFPFVWSVVSGSLPAGMTLDKGGLIRGAPTQPGTVAFTLQVQDSSTPPQTAEAAVTIQITNFLVITNFIGFPGGVVSRSYSQAVLAAGGTPPYAWSVTTPAFAPPGISLDAISGILSGIPTTSGQYQFEVQASDSSVPIQSVRATLVIYFAPVLAFGAATLPDGGQGGGYTASINIVGGVGPYTLSISAGALPAGLFFQATTNLFSGAQISGSPTTLGTSQFTLMISDSETPPMVATQTFSIRINPLLTMSQVTAPVGLQGQFYSLQYVASGGLPPLTFTSFAFPPLPPGLSFDPSTALLSGTPAAGASCVLDVSVADSSLPPQQASLSLQIYIAAILKVATTALPPIAVNTPFQAQLVASGGSGTFTWSVMSGALPTGMSLDSTTGNLTGTPTATGTSTFTLQVSDAGPPAQTATATYHLTVSSSLGRNDTIATATPLSNGTYQASISPASDPSSTGPDIDIYQLTANPGAIVSVETFAQRLNPPSPLDTAIDIVDATGSQLQTCAMFSFPGTQFVNTCENNDQSAFLTTDSRLFFQASPGATGPVTFYVRVYDFKGGARPDYIYQLTISGAN